MTLTTNEELKHLASSDNTNELTRRLARECLANREAQPVAGELGEIRVGRLPTMNQEEYPGLGDWWVQLRIGASGDEILARVYGATPDEAVARARALTAPPAPAVPREIPITSPVAAEYVAGWNACRAAMLTEAKCECSSIDYCGDCLRGMGNDSNLLIVFYVQIMPDDFVMQLHRF
ncbi:hypothetical protein [Serratia marcescens]